MQKYVLNLVKRLINLINLPKIIYLLKIGSHSYDTV